MRVTYLVSDLGGCGQYRCVIPGRQLVDTYGWDVSIQRAPDLSQPLPEADLYVFQRQTDPRLVGIARELRRKGKVVLGEVDDWFPGLASHFGSAPMAGYVQAMLDVLAACDSVTCSTPPLAAMYANLGLRTLTVRNYLHWPMWENARVQSVGRVRVGFQGLWLSHHPDLAELRGIIGPWLRRRPDVRFIVAGGGAEVSEALDIPTSQLCEWPAVQWEHLATLTATMDVGLVPLADHRFNDGKSWLKGLEYAACGIPAIVSRTPEYVELAKHNPQTLVVDRRAHAWIHALNYSADREADEWEHVRDECREHARELSIDRHIDEWHDRFVAALDAGPREVTGDDEWNPRAVTASAELLGHKGAVVTYRIDGRDMVDACCPGCGAHIAALDATDYAISGSNSRLTAQRAITFECCGQWRLIRSQWKRMVTTAV